MPYNPYMPYPQPPYMQPGYQAPNQNPMGNYSQPQQPQANQPVFAFVNGIEGAKSYQMGLNQTAILMDTENSALYIKTSNGIGQASMQYYKVVQCSEEEIRGPQKKAMDPAYATKEELNAILGRLGTLEKAFSERPSEAPKKED